jgi:NTE family protein
VSDGKIGLVLSGGGARGAYEAGVLLHVADELPDLLRRIQIITGTSAGAVNGAFLASTGLTPFGVHRLADLWRSLVLDELVTFDRAGMRSLLRAGGLRLIGRAAASPPVGVLGVEGIVKLVSRAGDWRALRQAVRSGRFAGVALAATDIATGGTTLFVDHHDGVRPRWSRGLDAPTPVRTTLGPSHVMASAAIPILFPPIRVGSRWYMDGGVRYNTPLSPALSLGADALLILSVRAATEVHLAAPDGAFPGFGQIVGKVLDSVFLDRVLFDLDRLTRINDVVSSMDELGPGTLERAREVWLRRERPSYRVIPHAHVRPGMDLGALASESLARLAKKGGALSFARVLSALFQDDAETTGDAASFLLFDGGFCEELIQAGRRDARAAHDDLAKL